MIELDQYLSDLPLLHSWDGGKTWNTGGFNREILEAIHPHLSEGMEILETGAGNSTIFFLLHKPKRLVSIAPDAVLFERIHAYCDCNGIDRSTAQPHVDYSEWVLPTLARSQQFDFMLIDGSHNWPLVFVDFCYANVMLRQGGLLAIDDTQLHSVKELAKLLMEQPEFALVTQCDKTVLFRKTADVRGLQDWLFQPYIARKSKEYQMLQNPCVINDHEEYRELIAQLRQGLEARDARIVQLREEIEARDAGIAQLRRGLEARDAGIVQLREEIEARGANIEGLKAEISAVRQSTSWKLTAPLRLTMHLFRKSIKAAALRK
jgi:hypothetical protein